MRRRSQVTALVVAAGVGVLTPALAASAASGPSASATPMLQAAPAWASARNHVGGVAAGKNLTVTLWLGLPHAAEAAAFSRAVSTPGSPSYQHYLTSAQYSARTAPTTAQVAATQAWAKSVGLHTGKVSSGRLFVQASAPAAVVEKAFGTTLQSYRYQGVSLYAPTAAVRIPAALQKLGVVSVEGLDNHAALIHPDAAPPAVFKNAAPCSTYDGQHLKASTFPPAPEQSGNQPRYILCGNTVNSVRTEYGLASTYAAGITGAGQKVVIVDAFDSPTMVADANSWSSHYGVPQFATGQYVDNSPPGLSSIPEGVGPTNILIDPQGWSGEQTLDVEAVHGMAPGATIEYDGALSPESLDVTLAEAITTHLGDEVSNSWGSSGESASDQTEYQAFLTQAVSTGIGVYFSAGDSGDESMGTGTDPTPDFPASDDMVTAVGGTSIELDKKNKLAIETGWGTGESTLSGSAWTPDPTTPTYLYGGGGGISTVFDQPAYQVGVVPDSLSKANGSTPMRVEPDISAIGDPSTGFVIGQTQTFPDGSTQYSEYREGGTSVSCPIMAGIVALASQQAGTAVGFANPAIYALAKAGSTGIRDVLPLKFPHSEVRSDYASGQISGPVTTTLRVFSQYASLAVTKKYDDVTGVGTPNGALFIALGKT